MSITYTSAYKFVSIGKQQLVENQVLLKGKAIEYQLKGTILLSSEGINLSLASETSQINLFKLFLSSHSLFSNLIYKDNLSNTNPFKKLHVKIKDEIITFGVSNIKPEVETAPHLPVQTFQQWYQDQREMIVLDARNNYEYEMGTFKNAIHLNIENFRDFPQAIKQLPSSYKGKPIVTFCTGGIRCEKASALMLQLGFKEVYQLEGGIIHYLNTCGKDYFEGQCFVFDDRIAID